MKRLPLLLLLLLALGWVAGTVLAQSTTGSGEEGTGAAVDSSTPGTTEEAPAEGQPAEPGLAEFAGQPLLDAEGDYFMAVGICAECHTDLTDTAGNDISFDTLWRATTHANAARDPYWLATVRAEVIENPALRGVIEDKCATCHMPMARTTAVAGAEGDPQVAVLDDGFVNPEHSLHQLAMDGVSCTSCHQIQPTNLGEPESFSGGYVVDTEIPLGERPIFGPYAPTEEEAALMADGSGYPPVQSDHMARAELCATCHTLHTPFLNIETGEVGGLFPEQMAYFEWRSSDHAERQTCQDCHMPAVEGEVSISFMSDMVRPNVRQHRFLGGNVFILRMLGTFGEELGVTASSEHFEDIIGRTVERLQREAAELTLSDLAVADGRLTATVTVQNKVGHKFPTGFPSRRVWLHVTVRDGSGNAIFESGAVDADGSIAGNDNDADAAAYEPHYTTVESADQVQIYEPILGDTAGAVTTTLLHGATYLKDNRLLPEGFEPSEATEDTAVHGRAAEDGDFGAGGDRVTYVVAVGESSGPYTVEAELLFQAIGYRWAQNLGRYEAEENTRFIRFYDGTSNAPVTVVTATASVE